MADLSGEWHNQHGSRMRLEIAPDGAVSGTFTSALGLSKDQTFRLTGFAAGEVLAFVVDFGKYRTLTAWTGQCCTGGGEAIRAMWHMSVSPPPGEAERVRWRGTWTGEDVFRREPATQAASPGRMPSHPVAFFDEEW